MRHSWHGYLSIYRRHPALLLWPAVAMPLGAFTGLIGNSPGHSPWLAAGVQAVLLAFIFGLGWAITALTPGPVRTTEPIAGHLATPAPDQGPAPLPSRRPRAELTLALIFILLAQVQAGRILPGPLGWLRDALTHLTEILQAPVLALLPPESPLAVRAGLALRNPLFAVVLPWLAARALGSRFGRQGLEWRWLVLGFVLAAPFIAANLVEWSLNPAALGPDLLAFASNFFVNGYSEEFLWRGFIQPRLIQLTRRPAQGIVLGGLGFGLWHYWTNLQVSQSPWLALAACFLAQAPFGVLLGYLAWRTRSLVAATVLHMWMNT